MPNAIHSTRKKTNVTKKAFGVLWMHKITIWMPYIKAELKAELKEWLKAELKEWLKEWLKEEEMVLSFLQNGVSPEIIAKSCSISMKQIKELSKRLESDEQPDKP